MKRILVILLIGAPVAQLAAQTGKDRDEAPAFSENARSEYVLIPAVVEDAKGHFVDGLQRQSFRLLVDGVPVALDSFDRDDSAPVSFAFLLDVSGSMETAEKLDWAKKAIRGTLRHARPGDDFALFAFSEGTVRSVSDFGTETKELLRRLKALRPEGDTALLDAVAATPSRMVRGRNGKRAILLFTDGVDNSSQLSREELQQVLERVSIPVYSVGLVTRSAFDRNDPEPEGLDVTTLQSLGDWSGGKLFLPHRIDEMGDVVSRISKEIRRQYLLGFSPSGSGSSRYRAVSVSVAKTGNWKIRTRRGYTGTSPRSAGG